MDLTDVARVKSQLGITQVSDDLLLKRLVEAVSCEAEMIMARSAQTLSRTEYHDTERGQRLVCVQAWPITSVTSVYYDTEGLFTDAVDLLTTDDWRLVRDGERGEIALQFHTAEAPRSVKVTYTGGMAANTTAFMTSYPDVAQAVTDQVAYVFNRRFTAGVSSVSTQGGSVSVTGGGEMLPSVKATLMRHRRAN